MPVSKNLAALLPTTAIDEHIMNPIEKIEQAFLQLSFSMKTMCYFELRKVDKENFDTEVKFTGPDIGLPHNEFQTYNDLILASQNAVIISLGLTAITFEEAIRILRNKNLNSSEVELLDLLYMVRCAFGHGMINPVWKIKKSFRRPIDLSFESFSIQVDLSRKNEQPFNIEDIGGYSYYYRYRDEILRLLNS